MKGVDNMEGLKTEELSLYGTLRDGIPKENEWVKISMHVYKTKDALYIDKIENETVKPKGGE